jgi:PII-like signaling protein
VNEDCLKLTAYYSERHRSGDRFQADALLELCERHALQTSVLLRGVEGFGTRQVLQTERLLTLSEDLPVVTVAVDTRARVEAALPEFEEAMRHGLLTIERARMLTGAIEPVALAEELHDATKLTIYCGRYERAAGRPAFAAIVDLLHRRGVTAATVMLGVDGTAHGVRERARFLGRNSEVPLMIVAIAPGALIGELLPECSALLARPLMTLERVRVCKLEGRRLAEPHHVPEHDEHGLATWVKLMLHAGQDSKHDGHPLYVEVVRRLRAAGASGATVVPGIWGYYGSRPPQGDKLLSLRRHVPLTTVVVDTPARAAQWFQIIDELTDEAGAITSELVPAFRARGEWGSAGGLRLAIRQADPS